MAAAVARVTVLATLSLTFTPFLATSLSTGDRPSVVEEANAALFAEGLVSESRGLWEDRGPANMAERGGRVLMLVAERGDRPFQAGRIASRGSLLGSGLVAGDELMRTALAGPQDISTRMSLAANLMRRGIRVDAPAGVMTAALRTDQGPGSTANDGAELAYAPSAGPSASSRFNDILQDRGGAFIPPIGEKDHSWAATPLSPAVFSKEEQTCLATGIYFEARGEVSRGQEAVAQVILNRVRAPSYPDTICGVVYQNRHMRNRCQFSFACDGIPDRITNKAAYAKAERIALATTKGEIWLPEVGSATHYHATYVRPRWARAMERVDKIGLHVFYRTFGGGWN
ncbi:cell wall hydrolase [Aureimonas mangrovi]|uniref:cell wall hydrolase n=1 Tax=Aureimonas mangrovi TaxID=2758041 RepID=UPI001FE4F004|nr:cell wall hydrolase [Aureimonas mangrovi]